MEYMPTSHFLSLPRPSSEDLRAPIVDTTTLAAHDFDVDPRTGFMPPHPPIERLRALDGQNYERWEDLLALACSADLQLADKQGGLTSEEERRSEQWRTQVRLLPILPITPLLKSEILLRRAHCILASIMHFYIHSLPISTPEIRIPPPITLPLLQVSRELQLPPVSTYSDTVLYNWGFLNTNAGAALSHFGTIDPQNLRVLTSFTSTPSESHFYLTSARIELIGVRALLLMQSTLDELFVGDAIAVRRITEYLNLLGASDSPSTPRGIIHEMETELNNMSPGCDPQVFYDQIRPWFRGIEPNNLKDGERRWIFEGIEMDERLEEPTELSGPSAGQSSLIHALDVFLGVQQYSHSRTLTGRSSTVSENDRPSASFLSRMQLYMPRHHRNFLTHLQNQNTKRSLRALVFEALASAGLTPTETVQTSECTPITIPSQSSLSSHSSLASSSTIPTIDALNLLSAYNAAVTALKKFRDSHIVIVTKYIIGPAARAKRAQGAQVPVQVPVQKDHSHECRMRCRMECRMEVTEEDYQSRMQLPCEMKGTEVELEVELDAPLKGSGGTELAQFLKGVRDGTKDAVIASS